MATRKGIGNAKRFKILQRDGFQCQYCGRTPPAVRLHVDHVVAVVDGGGDDEANLVASCSDCNHGKFTKALDPATVPRDFKGMADDAADRAKQLAAYRKALAKLREEIDQSIDAVGAAYWGGNLTWSYERAQKQRSQVEKFLGLLGLADVIDAARIARAKFGREYDDKRWTYFCGVFWNKCTERGIRGNERA